jgi:hypothetical protein
VVSFIPQPLYPWGKYPQYPLDRRIGGPQSQYGHNGEEKNAEIINRVRIIRHNLLVT